MSYEITAPKGEAFCAFCKANDWPEDRGYSPERTFRTVRYSSNEYQFYTFTICDQCAGELIPALAEAFRE
jgi:hypothetical protein